MIVMSVGNLLVGVHSLLSVTEFTLERDPVNVVNAGRPIVRTPTLFSTRKLTVESDSESKERGKTFKCNSYLIDHLGIHAREKLDEKKVV